jgi:hypothetical protein
LKISVRVVWPARMCGFVWKRPFPALDAKVRFSRERTFATGRANGPDIAMIGPLQQ